MSQSLFHAGSGHLLRGFQANVQPSRRRPQRCCGPGAPTDLVNRQATFVLEGGDLERWILLSWEDGKRRGTEGKVGSAPGAPPVSQTGLSKPLCHLTLLTGLQGAALQRANEEGRDR